jgi:SAM-dependent methyltransferase
MSQEPQNAKDLNRSQFGANAANYATSIVHAKGASLARMVELVQPQPAWKVLDVATAAGHTAFTFAPHVASVTATDLTPEMVDLAAERAIELGHSNVTAQLADAEALPFEDGSFDLVTCRIAPHHFPNPAAFLTEVARVLTPGGTFAMVDNIVPDDAEVAATYNDWERVRDPSHIRALSLAEWVSLCEAAGLTMSHTETAPKRMGFEFWVNNMNVPEELRPKLLTDLLHADDRVKEFLQPAGDTQADAEFFLTEGLLVAQAPS